MNHIAVGIWEELEPGASPALPGDVSLGAEEMQTCQRQGRRVLLVRKASLASPGKTEQKGVAAITDSTVHFFPRDTGAVSHIWEGREAGLSRDEEGRPTMEIGDIQLRFEAGDEALLRNAFQSGCRGDEFPLYDTERTEQLRASEFEAVKGTPAILLSGAGNPAWRQDTELLQDASVRHSVELRKQLSPGVHEISCSTPPSIVLPLFIPVIFDRVIVPGERRTQYLAVPAATILTPKQQEARDSLSHTRDEMKEVHKRAVELGRHILTHETELFTDQDLSPFGLGCVKGGEMTKELETLADDLWDRAQSMAHFNYAPQNRHILVEAMELHNHVLDILRGLRLRAEAIIFNTWADLFFARHFESARHLLDVAYGTTAYDSKGTVTRGLCEPHYASLCRVAAEVVDRVAVLEGLHATALVPCSRVSALKLHRLDNGGEEAEFHPLTGHCAILHHSTSTNISRPEPSNLFAVRGNIAESLEGVLCSSEPRLLVVVGCKNADIYTGCGGGLAQLASYSLQHRLSRVELVPESSSPFGVGKWVIETGAGEGQASIHWEKEEKEEEEGEEPKPPSWTADPGVPVPAFLYLVHQGLERSLDASPISKSRLLRRMLDASLAQPAFTLQAEGEKRFNTSRSSTITYPAKLFTPPMVETELAAGLSEVFGEGRVSDELVPPSPSLLTQLDERRAELDRLQEELVELRRKLPRNSTFALPPRTSDSLRLEDSRETHKAATELLLLLNTDCKAFRSLIESFQNAF